MDALNSKPLPQRSKSGRRWLRWLRCARLFRFILAMGTVAYRLWRWWCTLTGATDD